MVGKSKRNSMNSFFAHHSNNSNCQFERANYLHNFKDVFKIIYILTCKKGFNKMSQNILGPIFFYILIFKLMFNHLSRYFYRMNIF
jgi:hypothetical protein